MADEDSEEEADATENTGDSGICEWTGIIIDISARTLLGVLKAMDVVTKKWAQDILAPPPLLTQCKWFGKKRFYLQVTS